MKGIGIFFILFLSVVVNLNAEDALVAGGKSPDGRYEVRIYQTDSREPSDYYYGVTDAKSGKLIQQLAEGGGFALYKGAKETASVLWHPSGEFFALTDHGTRHSMDLYIYEVTQTSVSLIKPPDYFQNALGRVNATEGYLISVVKPLRWSDDTLSCAYTFDATLEGKGRSPTYTTQFSLRLFHSPNMVSYLLLTSMSDPTAQ